MIIDGRKIAKDLLGELEIQVARLTRVPVFCDILVGSDPASAQYVEMKGKKAERVGMKFRRADFPSTITTEDLVAEIKKINQEPNLCGLIVQLPLPPHLDRKKILDSIDPQIDVDCTGEINTKKFYEGKPYLIFPTAAAVVELLDSTKVNLEQKNVLVIGQGELVGKPVTFLLKQRGLNVQIADINTKNTQELMKGADVIISAVGKPKLITGEIIKSGCVVIDAGTSESDGGIVGDADFESVSQSCAFLSPVPGGVGPVTVAMLLKNVLLAAKNKI
jgi:methylenetetrahydrofolate dehydrogenase (NADP+) / methenyltetrahydrofolate cyclohydrolase